MAEIEEQPGETVPPRDLQALFEAQAHRQDFLNAGKLDDTIGLCLSGGGYRAMLYHVGALIRLNELGFLPRIQEIASVSGGSITAGMMASAWPSLQFNADGHAENFIQAVAMPITRFATVGIDLKAILLGLLPGFSAARVIAKEYDRNLFAGRTLQDLPDKPRFTFMATNLQTGSGWRFAKDYAADYRVGRIDRPNLPLAQVVAASSAFPPMLSPVYFPFEAGSVKPMEGADLHRPPFTEYAVLTDGGVYDNLGLERIWRRCRTIFVSNAGRMTPELGSPTGRWVGQIFRTLTLLQQQAENSRKRILFGLHNQRQRNVAFWSIDTPISAYNIDDGILFTPARSAEASGLRTRLNRFSNAEIKLLLQAGYGGADASLRARGFSINEPKADLHCLDSAMPSKTR